MKNKPSLTTIATGVSIVIPVYNREHTLQRMWQSILAQTVKPGCVILVDNGSSDASPEILQSFADETDIPGMRIKLLLCRKRGAAAARNVGLAAVDTDWVMFFDSDDEMLPRHLEHAVNTATRYRDADIIGWDALSIRSDGSKRVMPFEPENALYHNIMHGCLATQRYMVRTDRVRQVGGWNESLRMWDDIELGTRLLGGTVRLIKAHGAPLVRVYEGDDTISGRKYSDRIPFYPTPLRIMAANLGLFGVDIIALKAMILAADFTREGSKEGRRWRRKILHRTYDKHMRRLLRFAYSYRRMGGRGVARILYPFVLRRVK